jgi:hypothetical protein
MPDRLFGYMPITTGIKRFTEEQKRFDNNAHLLPSLDVRWPTVVVLAAKNMRPSEHSPARNPTTPPRPARTTQKNKKNVKPDAGVEPATLRLDQSLSEKVKLRVSRSTD